MAFSSWANAQIDSIRQSFIEKQFVDDQIRLVVGGPLFESDSGDIRIENVVGSPCFVMKDLGFRVADSVKMTDNEGTLNYFIALRATKFSEMLCNFFNTYEGPLDDFVREEILRMLYHQASCLYEVIQDYFEGSFVHFCVAQSKQFLEDDKKSTQDCIVHLLVQKIFGLSRDYFQGIAELVPDSAFDLIGFESSSATRGGDILVALHMIKDIKNECTTEGHFRVAGVVTPLVSLGSGRTRSADSSRSHSESSACP